MEMEMMMHICSKHNKTIDMAKISASSSSILLILLFVSAAASRTKIYSTSYEDVYAPEGICKTMVESQGYACEEHQVTTKDGYVLGMQRLPKSHSGEAPVKPPVLLQHGLLMDGVTWLLNPPDQSLAFILADNGFDVWITNTRGTRYSRGHTSLSPDEQAYWEWSWDELAAYDLPAAVQYVNDQTGQKLHYVGHSMGTLIALAALSQGKLVNMLISAGLLSPVAHLNQITSELARAAVDMFLAEDLYRFGIHEFDPRQKEVIKLLEVVCRTPGVDCTQLITSVTGQNCCLNASSSDAFLEHEPQTTATKNMVHMSQMVRNGNVSKFDYGDKENIERYGQPTPPAYDMTSIPKDFPLFLISGGMDKLSDVNDVEVLLDSLRDHDGNKLMVRFIPEYAHVDFVFGVNANKMVYDPLMAFFKVVTS